MNTKFILLSVEFDRDHCAGAAVSICTNVWRQGWIYDFVVGLGCEAAGSSRLPPQHVRTFFANLKQHVAVLCTCTLSTKGEFMILLKFARHARSRGSDGDL